MATFGNQNFTGFKGVNLQGSTFIRVGGNDTYQGTIGLTGGSLDGLRAWNLPNKNGTFPISGTFAVQLPAALSNNAWFSTIATVSGVTAEDGITVNLFERGTYTYGGTSTQYILLRATPGAGQVTLHFQNLGQGTGYIELVAAYTAVR